MMRLTGFRLGLFAIVLGAFVLTGATTKPVKPKASPPPPPPKRVTIKMIALNDFHGYLKPADIIRINDPADPTKQVMLPVGGAAYFVSAVRALRGSNPLGIVVGAGDMVGASPLNSALLHDEPAIDALNQTGMEFTSVGNHEFDLGLAELRRKQYGGCFPGGTIGVDTCIDGRFRGASYKYLAANVIENATGKTIFPAFAIKTFVAGGKRIPVAFIGVVLKQTTDMVDAKFIKDVTFTDEADAVNAQLPILRKRGVHAFVVLVHQGLYTKIGPDGSEKDPCTQPAGDLVTILDRLDPSIPLVISGHTHWPYVCPNGAGTKKSHAFYTQAYRYGDELTDLDVTIDVATDKIVHISATNHLVVNDQRPNPLPSLYPTFPPDPKIAALVERASTLSAPLVNRVIGKIAADFNRVGENTREGLSGESTMGDLVADSRRDAPRAGGRTCDIGMINPGGIRADLLLNPLGSPVPSGDVTYGAVYSVLPFGDDLTYITLTGEQIERLLNQQFVGRSNPFILGISHGFSYTWDASKPDRESKVVPGSMMLDGKPIDPAQSYCIAIDEFLADGGDNYTVFKEAKSRMEGALDRDILAAYVTAHSPLAPPPLDRITRLH